jgi:hypothetical protein
MSKLNKSQSDRLLKIANQILDLAKGDQYWTEFDMPGSQLKSGKHETYHFTKADLKNLLENWDDKTSFIHSHSTNKTTQMGRPKIPARPIVDFLAEKKNKSEPHKDILYHGAGKDYPGIKALAENGKHSVDAYEPYPEAGHEHMKTLPNKKYDEIHSHFTLNVVDHTIGKSIMQEIHDRLKPDGVAHVSVRRDSGVQKPSGGSGLPSKKLKKTQSDQLLAITKELLNLAKNQHSVRFALGTSRARDIRDMAQQNGGQISSKDLKHKGISLSDLKLSHLVDSRGNITAGGLSGHIEAQPHQDWKLSTEEHGKSLAHLSPAEANHEATTMFIQRHSPKPSQLTRMEITPEIEQKLSDAGVLETFKKFNDMSAQSGHPANAKTIGWTRHTEGPDGIHIDEIQSDWPHSTADIVESQKKQIQNVKDWPPHILEQAQKYHPQGHMVGQIRDIAPEQIAGLAQQFAGHFPEGHFQKIREILFGQNDPNQMIHEAFLQHQRNQGKADKKIQMWTPESKGKMALVRPDEPVPGHMMMTYGQQPKKMGYKPTTYGNIETQDNPELVGRPTQEMVLKKSLRLLLKKP